jgi:hypothetical protein
LHGAPALTNTLAICPGKNVRNRPIAFINSQVFDDPPRSTRNAGRVPSAVAAFDPGETPRLSKLRRSMGTGAATFDRSITDLDLRLFEQIPSESTNSDRRSMLAYQLATRELADRYGYLEIGSHLGGSLQPHLLDPRCERIVSIDKRPAKQVDGRGLSYRYPDNSTQRMLDLLREVSANGLDKIACIDADVRELTPDAVVGPIHLSFIDGEHTDEAVLADFEFCLSVLADSGAIVFHDANVIYDGLTEAIRRLQEREVAFHAYNLPDALLVIEIGTFPLHEHPRVHDLLIDNHVGYLASLRANDHFRRWANLPLLRALRIARARLKRADVSETH